MKESLEELTIGQFIDLVSGNAEVILDHKHEIVNPSKLANAIRNIVFEYKEIADKNGANEYLSDTEDMLKAKLLVVVFSMCQTLVEFKLFDKVNEVLSKQGIITNNMTEAKLTAFVMSRLEQAKKTVSDLEAEHSEDSTKAINIRREFDAQTAALMAYYKFQIDTSTMKATLYAHLVARQQQEVKAQLATINK